MSFAAITLTLRLPVRPLFEGTVARLVVPALNGQFGVLPNHVDFVAALAPGVVSARMADGTDIYFGIDEGVFVKQGGGVEICTGRAVQGTDPGEVGAIVRAHFLDLDERERIARTALAHLEADTVRRFADLRLHRP